MKQENGINLTPYYLCDCNAECRNEMCKMDSDDVCHHTSDQLHAKNPESVKLFEELTKRFNLAVYNQKDLKTDEVITTIIFEEK